MYPTQRKRLKAASALIVLATTYGAASMGAAPMDTSAMLVGTQEVPQVQTAASATSSIVVAEDMSVTGSVITSEIEATMAHIHQGAMGSSGPVLVTLVKTADTQWSVPANTKLTTAQYQSYKAGNLYVNVHSAAHKDGEIRMQMKP